MSSYELTLPQEHIDDMMLALLDTENLRKLESRGYWIEVEREYADKGYYPNGFSILRAVAADELSRARLRLEAGPEDFDV